MKAAELGEDRIRDIGHAFGYYDYGEETGLTYAFSGKETETRLMNKLTAHYKPKDKGMTPAQAAAIPAVKDETPAQAGKTYDELMTRLNLIKP